jgi:hypothetical protein
MAHIFISYAREDEARIHPLVRALEDQGWSVFWDRHIPAGQTWRSYIGKALSDASCVMVAWSRHSIDSGWVSEEADEGKKRGMLVPVLLDAVEPPIGFRSIQAADLTNWQSARSSPRFEQLIHDIRATLHATLTPLEPKPNRQPFGSWQRKPKAPSRRFTYSVLMAMLLALVAVGGWWAYPTSTISHSGTKSIQDYSDTRKRGEGAGLPPMGVASGTTPAFYFCTDQAQCAPGTACVAWDGDRGKYYCKPICTGDLDCRKFPYPTAKCLPVRGSSLLVCNEAESSLLGGTK